MLTTQTSLNVCIVIWRLVNGVVHVILVPSRPRNPVYGTEIQNKVPGGGVEEGERAILGGRREVMEETDLVMKLRTKPVHLTRTRDKSGHTKEGYLAPRAGFRGMLRKGRTVVEEDSYLYDPIELPLDEAIKIVFHHERNKFHLNLLLEAKDYFEKRRFRTGLAA